MPDDVDGLDADSIFDDDDDIRVETRPVAVGVQGVQAGTPVNPEQGLARLVEDCLGHFCGRCGRTLYFLRCDNAMVIPEVCASRPLGTCQFCYPTVWTTETCRRLMSSLIRVIGPTSNGRPNAEPLYLRPATPNTFQDYLDRAMFTSSPMPLDPNACQCQGCRDA